MEPGPHAQGFLSVEPCAQVLPAFTEAWQELATEARTLHAAGWMAHPDRHLAPTGWNTVPVRYFGRDDADFSRLVPVLARLVSQTPQVITALYLSLEPGVELALHRGNPIGVARCHLGLVVPEGCAIEVAGEQRTWQEGEWLVFDDSVEHRAWNRSDRTRIVLSLDLEHPDVPVDRTIRMMRVLTRTYYVTMKRVPRSLQGKLSPVGRTISRIVRRLQGERQR